MFSKQCAEEDPSPGSTEKLEWPFGPVNGNKQEIRTDIPETTLQEATYCKLGGQLQSSFYLETTLVIRNLFYIFLVA